MTGTLIESRPSIPVAGIVFFVIAAGLVVAGLAAGTVQPTVGAIAPFLIGVALFLTGPRSFQAELHENEMQVHVPEATSISYDHLEGLWGRGRSSDPTKPGPYSFPIQVIHKDGVLQIPARLNVPSDDVFLFLYEHFPPEGARGVSSELEDYLARQESEFGQERVFAYRARSHQGKSIGHRRAAWISFAILMTGIIWIPVGIAVKTEAWWICGICLILFGFLFMVAFLASEQTITRGIKSWRKASLVVSPLGMALVQGDVKGEMKWDELHDVQLKTRPGGFQLTADGSALPGIILKFEGAHVRIADIYDQPLRIIFERIRAYWK
jgi:hypothetical protein